MSYSENLAKVVADQLARFVTLNRHQLAGHAANLDFWLAQARHALEALDGYEERFRRLKAGQAAYVAENGTVEYLLSDPDLRTSPEPPRRVPDAARREARRAVTEAAYRFLMRCLHDGLVDETRLRTECGSLGIAVEAADLRPKRGRPNPN